MSARTESLQHADKSFIPAAGHDWLLPLYDPIVKLLGGDKARRRLLAQAQIQPGHRVLDIGCGTGTLALLIKQTHPETEVVGFDPDSNALSRAERKFAKSGVRAQLDRGYADQLPYVDASLDRVFSSFVFHHLDHDVKQKALQEIRRVLKPGGTFHLLDFKAPEPHERTGVLSRWLHSSHLLQDNTKNVVLKFLNRAEFDEPICVEEQSMFFWQIAYYRATAAPER